MRENELKELAKPYAKDGKAFATQDGAVFTSLAACQKHAQVQKLEYYSFEFTEPIKNKINE